MINYFYSKLDVDKVIPLQDFTINGTTIHISDEVLSYRSVSAYVQSLRMDFEYSYKYIMSNPSLRKYYNIVRAVSLSDYHIQVMKKYIEQLLGSFENYQGERHPTDQDYGVITDITQYDVFLSLKEKNDLLNEKIEEYNKNAREEAMLASSDDDDDDPFLLSKLTDYDPNDDGTASMFNALSVFILVTIKALFGLILLIPMTISRIIDAIHKASIKKLIKSIESANTIDGLNDAVTKIFDALETYLIYAYEEENRLAHIYTSEQAKAEERYNNIITGSTKTQFASLVESVKIWPYHNKTIFTLMDYTLSHKKLRQDVFTLAWVLNRPAYEDWVCRNYKVYGRKNLINTNVTYKNLQTLGFLDEKGKGRPCLLSCFRMNEIDWMYDDIIKELNNLLGGSFDVFENMSQQQRLRSYTKLSDFLGGYGFIINTDFDQEFAFGFSFEESAKFKSLQSVINSIRIKYHEDSFYLGVKYQSVDEIIAEIDKFDDIYRLVAQKLHFDDPNSYFYYESEGMNLLIDEFRKLDNGSRTFENYVSYLLQRASQIESYEKSDEYAHAQSFLSKLKEQNIDNAELYGSKEFLVNAEEILNVFGYHCLYGKSDMLVRPLAILRNGIESNPKNKGFMLICSDVLFAQNNASDKICVPLKELDMIKANYGILSAPKLSFKMQNGNMIQFKSFLNKKDTGSLVAALTESGIARG